jgi:tRNA (guanine-N7-)-methyltransferase
MREFPHVFEPDGKEILAGDYHMKGRWNPDFFRNNHPIVLELGCGRGEYTIDLANRYPEKNFIGVDIKGSRMWKGASEALESSLANVAFLRTRIEFLEKMFGPAEISGIWLTFPDPQLKKPRKRLTSARFLNRYRNLMIPDGRIHLKTDNQELFRYTRDLLALNGIRPGVSTDDLYGSGLADEILSIRTHYESKFLNQGMKINYLNFPLPAGREFVEPLPAKESL